jgi:hypothetical protein
LGGGIILQFARDWDKIRETNLFQFTKDWDKIRETNLFQLREIGIKFFFQ